MLKPRRTPANTESESFDRLALGARRIVVLTVFCTAVLAACGGDDGPSDASTEANTEVSTPSGSSSELGGAESQSPDTSATGSAGDSTDTGFEPIELEHFNGTTLIDAPAVRPMSVSGEGDLEWIVALGVKPVAYGTRGQGEWPITSYQEPLPADVAYVDFAGGELPIEAIANQDPDLLTGFGFLFGRDNGFELLSEIAPVVGYDTADDFRTVGTLMAEALGRPADGAALIAELEAELQGLKDELGDVSDLTLSLLSGLDDGTVFVLTPEFNAAGFYYDDIGFGVTKVFDELGLDTSNDAEISGELSSAISVDDVIVCLTDDPVTDRFCNELPDNELVGLREETIVVKTSFSQAINVLAPGGLRATLDLISDEIAPQLGAP